MSELVICSRCIFDSNTPGIVFDSEGVCNYCRQVDALKAQYHTGTPQGEEYLNKKIEQIKRVGQRKKYDCVIGVSGGTDLSYLLIKALEWGLRPLAVHYDNTWNSAIATENIRKVTSDLCIVVGWYWLIGTETL
jgi:Ran GTPase-activating protein (RanGAP) involved in mRNA processing and transport